MRIRKSLILFFISISATLFSNAKSDQYRFHHLDVNSGLSHTDALCFSEDSLGFMWIGTNSGLQRFDGVNTESFYCKISNNFALANRILSLASSTHYLWVGTEGGLQLFDIKKLHYIQTINTGDTVRQKIREIQIDNAEKAWIVADDGVFLVHFDKNSNSLHFQKMSEIVKNVPSSKLSFLSVMSDNKGIIWFGGNSHILCMAKTGDQNSFQTFDFLHVNGEAFESGWLDVYARGNMLFVVSFNFVYAYSVDRVKDGVQLILKNKLRFSDLLLNDSDLKNVKNARFRKFVVDQNNTGWFSGGDFLLRIDNLLALKPDCDIFKNDPDNRYGFVGTRIVKLFLSNDGILWSCSYGTGISYIRTNILPFRTLNLADDKANTGLVVRSLVADNLNKIWFVLTGKGLRRYNIQTEELNDITNDEASRRFNSLQTSISLMSSGQIVGFSASTMFFIDPITEKITIVPAEQFIKQPDFGRVTYIFPDKFGRFWIAGWGQGLQCVSLNSDGKYYVESFSSNSRFNIKLPMSVNYLHYDEERNSLLAASINGLFELTFDENGDVKDVKSYFADNENINLLSNYFWPLQKDKKGNYWLGTLGGGLYKTKLNRSVNEGNGIMPIEDLNKTLGISFTDIEGMVTDFNGNIWVAGNGLVKINPEKLSALKFDIYDGLHNMSFKVGAATKDNLGNLFFGGLEGITYFNPREIKSSYHQKKAQFTWLAINGERVLSDKLIDGKPVLQNDIAFQSELKLAYFQNNISIGFSPLNFFNPQKCRFRYRLIGFDKNWNYEAFKNNMAIFSNLKPGHYTFELMWSKENGSWVTDPIRLNINIMAPWWLTKFAFLIYFILLIAGVYFVYSTLQRIVKLKNKMALQEELHQVKLEFFTNISHELRTPLTLIQDPLEDLLSGNISSKASKQLYFMMYKNTSRLLNLVNELLDFRKAEKGVASLHATKFLFNDLVSEVCALFSDFAVKREVNFYLNLGDAVCEIWADREKMEKIIFNLLSNAFKYTPRGGQVRVELILNPDNVTFEKGFEVFKVGNEINSKSVVGLLVSDSGVGISGESLPRLFDRFFQVKAERSHLHLGSGVGLALVKSLVLLHQGVLSVASKRGEGTQFLIVLPLGNKHLQSEDIFEDEIRAKENFLRFQPEIIDEEEMLDLDDFTLELPGKKEASILLVEDDVQLRRYIKGKLSTYFNVTDAENGADGLVQLKNNMPDIIITDLLMPVMDGKTLIETVKKDLAFCHIPIILLTAKSTEDERLRLTEAGADEFLPKPIDLRFLLVKIRSMLEMRKKMVEKFSKNALFDVHELGQAQQDKEFILELEAFIEARLSDPMFDVIHICEGMGIGRTNLYQKVKSVTDQTLGDFIKRVRLRKAVQIMLTEDVSIAEVAYRVGVSSPSYFTKTFKDKFGKTPSEFIEQCTKKGQSFNDIASQI